MKEYIVFSVVGGRAYSICHKDGKVYVSNSDIENVALFDEATAIDIAERNSKGEFKYQYKKI